MHAPELFPGQPGSPGFNNQTLRQIVHTSIGGDRVRVRLSTFGDSALVVGAAHIGRHAEGAAIMPGSDRTLTFGVHPSITIPPGAVVLSDPVDLDIPPLSDVAVSIYLPGNTGPQPGTSKLCKRRTSPRPGISREAPACRLFRLRVTWIRGEPSTTPGSGWRAWR